MNDPCDDKVTAAYMAGVIEGASSQPGKSSEDVKAQIAVLKKTRAKTEQKMKDLEKATAEELRKIKAEKEALVKEKEAAEAQADNAEKAERKLEAAKGEAEAAKREAQTAQEKAKAAQKQAETATREAEAAKAALENERVKLEAEKEELVKANKKAEAALAEQKAANTKLVAAVAAAEDAAKAELAKAKKDTQAAVAKAKKDAQKQAEEIAAANKAKEEAEAKLENEKAAAVEEALEEAKAEAAEAKEEAEAKLAKAKEEAEAKLVKAKEEAKLLEKEKAEANEAIAKANEEAEAALAEQKAANTKLVAAVAAAEDAAKAKLTKAKKEAEAKLVKAKEEAKEKAAAVEALAKAEAAKAKEAEEKAKKAQAGALAEATAKAKEVKVKAEAEAYKIQEARNKIKSQILNNTGKDIYGDIDFLLNKIQITEKAAKKAETELILAKRAGTKAETELILAKRAGSKAEAELKSARDILISSKDIFLDDMSTSESDSSSDDSDDSDDELSKLRRNVQEEPPKEPPIKDLLGKWIKEGKRSRGIIIEQRGIIEKQKRELKKEEDSLTKLMQQQETATKKIDATKQATEELRATNKTLSEKINRIEDERDVWKTKDEKKRKELEALKNDYNTMQAEFIQMKKANTTLIEEKEQLNTVAQGIVNGKDKKIADKDKKIAELEDRLATIEKTEAEEIVDLKNVITVIKDLVGIEDTKQLIQELTNVRRIIDKANQNGAELTFKTLPEYIKKYRLYQINQARLMEESKNDTGKTIQELDKRLTNATASFTEILMNKQKRKNLIPLKMRQDLVKTFTTADTLPKLNKLNQSTFEKQVGLTKQELILEYYSANYDKFIEHLTLVCDKDYSESSIIMINNYKKFLKSMILFGELLHEKIELLMKVPRTHFTKARDTLQKLEEISKINSRITDLQANKGDDTEISKLQSQRKNMIEKLPTGIPVVDPQPSAPQIPSPQKAEPFVRVRF